MKRWFVHQVHRGLRAHRKSCAKSHAYAGHQRRHFHRLDQDQRALRAFVYDFQGPQ